MVCSKVLGEALEVECGEGGCSSKINISSIAVVGRSTVRSMTVV